MINLPIAYEMNLWSHDLGNDFALGHSLFGKDKLSKTAALDKYSYSGFCLSLYYNRSKRFLLVGGVKISQF